MTDAITAERLVGWLRRYDSNLPVVVGARYFCCCDGGGIFPLVRVRPRWLNRKGKVVPRPREKSDQVIFIEGRTWKYGKWGGRLPDRKGTDLTVAELIAKLTDELKDSPVRLRVPGGCCCCGKGKGKFKGTNPIRTVSRETVHLLYDGRDGDCYLNNWATLYSFSPAPRRMVVLR